MNSPQIERTWRDEVMDESARGFNSAENLDAMISAIRRLQPQLSCLSVFTERRVLTSRRCVMVLPPRVTDSRPLI